MSAKLIRSMRAHEESDPDVGIHYLTAAEIKARAALADVDDIIDLALAVAEKRLDPQVAIKAFVPTSRLRSIILAGDDA